MAYATNTIYEDDKRLDSVLETIITIKENTSLINTEITEQKEYKIDLNLES